MNPPSDERMAEMRAQLALAHRREGYPFELLAKIDDLEAKLAISRAELMQATANNEATLAAATKQAQDYHMMYDKLYLEREDRANAAEAKCDELQMKLVQKSELISRMSAMGIEQARTHEAAEATHDAACRAFAARCLHAALGPVRRDEPELFAKLLADLKAGTWPPTPERVAVVEKSLVDLDDVERRTFAVRALLEWENVDDRREGPSMLRKFIEQIERGDWPPKSEGT